MRKRSLAALLAGALALCVASLPATAQQSGANGSMLGPQGLETAEVAAIKSLIEAWTKDLSAGDYGAWAKYWARDPVLAPANHERIVGEQGIAKFARENLGGSTGFSFNDWTIVGREDLAVVTNTLTWEASGGASTYNQIIVLRKVDGNWRVQSVIYNSAG